MKQNKKIWNILINISYIKIWYRQNLKLNIVQNKFKKFKSSYSHKSLKSIHFIDYIFQKLIILSMLSVENNW